MAERGMIAAVGVAYGVMAGLNVLTFAGYDNAHDNVEANLTDQERVNAEGDEFVRQMDEAPYDSPEYIAASEGFEENSDEFYVVHGQFWDKFATEQDWGYARTATFGPFAGMTILVIGYGAKLGAQKLKPRRRTVRTTA